MENFYTEIEIAQVKNGFIFKDVTKALPHFPVHVFCTLDEVFDHLLFVFEGRKPRLEGDDRPHGRVIIERRFEKNAESQCCTDDECYDNTE